MTNSAYVSYGDIVTASSMFDPARSVQHIAYTEPLTRWSRGVGNFDATLGVLAALERFHRRDADKAYVPILVCSPNETWGKYLDADGNPQDTPVNKWPYVQDYKLATAIFAHCISTEHRPHEMQIISQTSHRHLPLTPHSKTSINANTTTLDQFRGMASATWDHTNLMAIFSGPYNILLPSAKKLVKALCFVWVFRAHAGSL